MADEQQFKPFIKPEESVAEFTVKAIAVGIGLSIILCAANVYVGLKVGMTVSASIPAAVISMGILRGLLRTGTILENNMVQTIASAGESVAAGVIFTVPAIVLLGIWTGFKFIPTLLIGMLGGFLGILFMIPLRKALIVEEKELAYPEGVACAEILEAGQTGGSGVKFIFGAMGLGIIYTLLVKFGVLAGELVKAIRIKKMAFSFGGETGLALLAVGYIVGLNIGALVFIGGVIAWYIAIPIFMSLASPELSAKLAAMPSADAAGFVWDNYIRYMGAGAMVVGGAWSIWCMRRGILSGIKEVTKGFSKAAKTAEVKRTDQDLPMGIVMPMLGVIVAAVFIIYWVYIGSVGIAAVCTVAMVITAFLFVAVSSYIVGLVGSSNNPVSGMTIFTLLFAATLLLAFGATGNTGMLATLVVAGVVCCAACAAGDMSQDLKTGYLVGATPKKQQLGQIIGVAVAAFVTAPTLVLLYKTMGIGKSTPLKAPQAQMFQGITEALFAKNVPWTMLLSGAGVAVLLIIFDQIAKAKKSAFRLHVMPVAVGIYLPVTMAVPILIGGIVKYVFKKKSASDHADKGVLICSGLIAGEALTGIAIAGVVFATGTKALPQVFGHGTANMILGGLAFLGVAFLISRFAGASIRSSDES